MLEHLRTTMAFSKSFVKRVQTLDGDKWKAHIVNPMLYHFFSNSEKGQIGTIGLPFAAEELRFSAGLRTGVAAGLKCKRTDKPILDYFTIFGEDTFPISNFLEPSYQKSLVLNVETTTQQGNLAKYIAEKIDMFAGFVDAHKARGDGTDCKQTVQLFKQQIKGGTKAISYSSFDSIVDGDKVDFKLIVAGKWDAKTTDWNAINAHISENNAGDKRIIHVENISPGSWLLKTDTDCEFMVGQLDKQDILDLAAMYDASKSRMKVDTIEDKKVRFEFVDRMLWMITESAFDKLNAHMAYNSLKEFTSQHQNRTGIHHSAPSGAAGTISNISKIGSQTFDSGLTCEMFQIRMPLSTLAKLGRVERTIASKAGQESLQRLPDGNHCKKMAKAIEREKRFHLPVFAFLPSGTDVHPNNQTITFHGQHDSIPYQWLIVDGQHRMLSHYYLRKNSLTPADYTRLTEQFTIDICAYVPPQAADQAKIREAQTEIFYQINYLGKQPDSNLRIYHESHMLKRPSSFVWENEKTKDRHKMLAMRFFSHLNKTLHASNPAVFHDPVFDVLLTGQGMKISSLLTYLSPYFDFGTKFQKNGTNWDVVSRKNKSLHPTLNWKKKDNTMIWGEPNSTPYLAKKSIQGPHPSECDAELKQLAEDFVSWLKNLDVKKKPDGNDAANWADGIFSWITLEGAKSHYLAALWIIFVHDYGVKGTIHDGNLEVDKWKSTKITGTSFGISDTNQKAIGRAICRNPLWRPISRAQPQIKEIGKYIISVAGGYNFDATVIADAQTLDILNFA